MTFEPDKQAALEEALAQAKLNPVSADNWNQVAIASLQVSNLEAAVEYIGRAINLEPQVALNYSNRGRVLFALGRKEEALADYTQALELEPTSELYSNRSVINLALGRAGASLYDLNEAFDVAPTPEAQATALLNRVAFFANKGMSEDAWRDINRVIELQPEDPRHRLTRANLAFALNQHELGLSEIEEALRLDQSGLLRSSLLQLADQLEAYLPTSPQPEISLRLIQLIRHK